MKERSFDLVVLGAGPGGYVSAIRAAQLGLSVAIVEKDIPGGVCLNIGCIPSKALIRQASVYHDGKVLFAKTGVKVDDSGFDYAQVWKTSRAASDKLSKGVQYLLRKNKIELVKGKGRLQDTRSVLVDTASGPELLRGAGAIGMEFAYILRSFGVEVTIVELLDQVLPLEDAESAAVVQKSFAARGITLHTSAKASGVTVKGDKVEMAVTLKDGSSTVLVADRVLVSVGRAPNTDGIGLEEMGVKMTRGLVDTGDYYETSVPGIYAIGDITAQPQLAHVASKAGEIAVEHISALLKGSHEPEESRINPYTIPSAVYCEPEVASFGLSEKKARDLGARIKVARFPYMGIGKAVATEMPEGQVKIVFDPETRAVLGASIVGAGATDTIHELLLASVLDLDVEKVAEMIHAHPTLAEGVMEAAKAALGRAIHI